MKLEKRIKSITEKLKSFYKKDKKTFMLTGVAAIALLLTVIGAAYAYFAGYVGGGQGASIQANTGTTDSLTFIAGDPIRIHATMDNFKEGMNSLKGETTATAKLMANNATNEASGRYNVFFVIEENTFEYSTPDGKTELILKVTDPNGNEIENITGLKRIENGFDITTRSGAFLISADYDIVASGNEAEEQTWNVEVTLVNLNSDQDINKGKKLNGYVYITTEQIGTYELPVINSFGPTASYNSITVNTNVTPGTSEIDKYYYAIEEDTSSLAYTESKVKQMKNEIAITDDDFIESDSPTYTFENLKDGTNYIVYSYTIDKIGIRSNTYETTITTADYQKATITQLTVSESTLTSLKVNAKATAGSTSIVKYLYSINNGEWQESNTFTNLNEDTEYTIKVKAVDEKERESDEFSITARTVKYNLPTIKNVTTSTTASSITVTIEAEKGDANVSKYYFNINNEWKESDTNTYTFNNLNSNTDYSIKVKVSDTNNRESAEGVATAKTDYVLPSVTSLTHSNTLYSITVTANATKGSNEVSKYYFSKDNGVTWSTGQTSNSYTFDNLLDTTEYKIKVKVSDTDERYSTEYYEAIATATYINPSITTVTTSSKTYNSITLQTTATKGSNNVSKYYYSTDGGATWSAGQTTNTYTISGLNEETEYNVLVKVEDTNGRFSTIYSSYKETTNKYKIPTVTAEVVDITSSSFKINATVTKGDGNIVKYEYSKDGGSNWITVPSSSLTDSYIFSGLTYDTEHSVAVRVTDSNGRPSSNWTKTVRTAKANFTNTTANVIATYNGSAKSINVNVGTTATIYYSTDTQLTTSNYTSGSTTNPSRTNAGETTVYWCAVKSGYNTLCSNNKITINKATPTFTVASTSLTIGAAETTTSTTYTYNGDGTVSCSPTSGTYASCSINTTNKTITFSRVGGTGGTQSFTISASAGTNYNATSKSVSVTIQKATLAVYIKNQYTSPGSNGLYYHSTSLENGAGDNSYRYAGASSGVNNYVCFGSTATPCPEENLYRIIGVFGDQVKLIKATAATSALLGTDGAYISDTAYYWDRASDYNNTWSHSLFNTVNLNTNFLNNIGSNWANKIATTTWQVGGMEYAKIKSPNTVKDTYDVEVGASKTDTPYSAKIGLMYVSDYGYAASQEHWTKALYYYDNATTKANNWMYLGQTEWTISRYADNTISAFSVTRAGHVSYNGVGYNFNAVRPVFYLESAVKLSSGTGTSTDPYRIA